MLDALGIFAGAAFLVGSIALAVLTDRRETRASAEPEEAPPAAGPAQTEPPSLRLVRGDR